MVDNNFIDNYIDIIKKGSSNKDIITNVSFSIIDKIYNNGYKTLDEFINMISFISYYIQYGSSDNKILSYFDNSYKIDLKYFEKIFTYEIENNKNIYNDSKLLRNIFILNEYSIFLDNKIDNIIYSYIDKFLQVDNKNINLYLSESDNYFNSYLEGPNNSKNRLEYLHTIIRQFCNLSHIDKNIDKLYDKKLKEFTKYFINNSQHNILNNLYNLFNAVENEENDVKYLKYFLKDKTISDKDKAVYLIEHLHLTRYILTENKDNNYKTIFNIIESNLDNKEVLEVLHNYLFKIQYIDFDNFKEIIKTVSENYKKLTAYFLEVFYYKYGQKELDENFSYIILKNKDVKEFIPLNLYLNNKLLKENTVLEYFIHFEKNIKPNIEKLFKEVVSDDKEQFDLIKEYKKDNNTFICSVDKNGIILSYLFKNQKLLKDNNSFLKDILKSISLPNNTISI